MSTLDIFRHATDFRTFAAGETVFRQGDAGDFVYVVKEGQVEIRVNDRVLYVVGPGEIFGEMALIDARPRSATAVCRREAKLVGLDERRFLFLVQQTPFFALQVMRVMADRLRRMDQKA